MLRIGDKQAYKSEDVATLFRDCKIAKMNEYDRRQFKARLIAYANLKTNSHMPNYGRAVHLFNNYQNDLQLVYEALEKSNAEGVFDDVLEEPMCSVELLWDDIASVLKPEVLGHVESAHQQLREIISKLNSSKMLPSISSIIRMRWPNLYEALLKCTALKHVSSDMTNLKYMRRGARSPSYLATNTSHFMCKQMETEVILLVQAYTVQT